MTNNTAAICEALVAIVADVLQIPLSPTPEVAKKTFPQLGVDSVSIYQIQIQLEERYGLALDDGFLFEHATPAQAAATIAQQLAAKGSA
jgi:acyl carrier protein